MKQGVDNFWSFGKQKRINIIFIVVIFATVLLMNINHLKN